MSKLAEELKTIAYKASKKSIDAYYKEVLDTLTKSAKDGRFTHTFGMRVNSEFIIHSLIEEGFKVKKLTKHGSFKVSW